MNTKNKIVAILMASIVAMAVGMPMAMGAAPPTEAEVNDVLSTYDCSATNIAPQPDPINNNPGTVNFNLVVTDDNGGDTIPDGIWEAKWGTSANVTLSGDSPINLDRTFTNTSTVPAKTPAGTYDVIYYHNGTEVCNTTVTVTSAPGYSIDFNAVSYGMINPDSSSTVPGDDVMETVGEANATGGVKPTIQNDGNVAMDVNMSIADGANPEPLFEDNTAAEVDASGLQWLSTTPTEVTFDVNIAIAGTTNINTTLWVPAGIEAGIYSGTLTITGI